MYFITRLSWHPSQIHMGCHHTTPSLAIGCHDIMAVSRLSTRSIDHLWPFVGCRVTGMSNRKWRGNTMTCWCLWTTNITAVGVYRQLLLMSTDNRQLLLMSRQQTTFVDVHRQLLLMSTNSRQLLLMSTHSKQLLLMSTDSCCWCLQRAAVDVYRQ